MPDPSASKPSRDFVIRIEQTGENHYRVRARTHDNREASAAFESPFSEKDLKIFLLTVGQPRRTVRRGRVPRPMRETVEFGSALYRAVMSGAVGQLFASARHDAFLGDYGLRVQLRLSGAPQLSNLPWEFLFDGRDFLALLPDTPVVRYLDLERPPRTMTVAPPLNMLVTISAPSDLQQLDAGEERDKLLAALESMDAGRRPRVEFTPDACLSTLERTLRQAKLRGRPFHIWHYIGHGGFDPDQASSFLVFTTPSGAPEPVDGFQLGTLFSAYPATRLAVLNACEGARTDNEDPFAGVASALVEKGIPAVIAMQFEISDEVAARLSAEFYEALAEGLPVDAALTEARRAVFFMPNKLEWATPVLFMRTPDGRLFDLSRPAQAEPVPPPSRPAAPPAVDESELERYWTTASAAYYTENWQQAVEMLERIVAIRPDYRAAASRLERARHMQRCTALYDEGCQAMEQEDWRAAESLLNQVADIESSFRDVQNQLAEARRRARLAELYEEAGLLSQAGHWAAVVRVFQRLHALAPDFPDSQGLAQRATAELQAAQTRQLAERGYREGIEAIERDDWEAAERALAEVQKVSPGYEATEALLSRVRRELLAAQPPKLVAYLTAEPETIEEGDSLNWVLQLHNAGQVELHNVTVFRDQTKVEGPLHLKTGEARRFSFSSTFTAAGEKTRTLRVTGVTERGVEVTTSAAATATVRPKKTVPARDLVSLVVAVVADAPTVQAGEQLTWTVTVHNNGSVDLRRLTLERDGRKIETFSLAAGQSLQFTSQSRYTTPGVKEKAVVVSGSAANGKRVFEAASGSAKVLAGEAPEVAKQQAPAGFSTAPATVFREYLKKRAREERYNVDCPLCGVAVSARNLVQHYDKMHAGQPGPVPAGYTPPPAARPQQAPPVPAPTYRDKLKQFARDHRDNVMACPVCGVEVSTDNILRHYDRQHPGAVGSEPALKSAPAGRTGSRSASAPEQSPAAAYREELKTALREFAPDDYVYCPLCQATVKAGGLINHYDKMHRGQYPT